MSLLLLLLLLLLAAGPRLPIAKEPVAGAFTWETVRLGCQPRLVACGGSAALGVTFPVQGAPGPLLRDGVHPITWTGVA